MDELSKITRSRRVERQVRGLPTQDGDGVRLTRILTANEQQRLDPFLMIDLFGSDEPLDYIGGFPDHPHRGFETITYMLAGRMRHRDHLGNEGLLQAGDVQWMTAGRGIIHSEMPEQLEGLMRGFQIWLNLPSHLKMNTASYQDIRCTDIPRHVANSGMEVRIIAGSWAHHTGIIQRPHTLPLMLDVHLQPGNCIDIPVPAEHNALVIPYEGNALIEDVEVACAHMAILSQEGDGVRLLADRQPLKALMLAGQPLHEPIVQYGPFVMNTRAEIMQTMHDFRNGRLTS